MRLLNTQDLTFQEFFDNEIPTYAILSHRWSRDEISHRDFLEGTKLQSTGYAKIVSFSQLALAKGLLWGWVDTCCIDKSSSAELTEAINSMFRWYERAAVCTVHLADIVLESQGSAGCKPPLTNSDWFNRGWTLQELIAPSIVEFYDAGWKFISDKYTLTEDLSTRTGVESRILQRGLDASISCVAEKMSWAAHRKTTRIEDKAYCLLGLFNINMPLLYGEGNSAFSRLQEEIIRKYDDESIFVYSLPARGGDSMELNPSVTDSTKAREEPMLSEVGALCMGPEYYVEKVIRRENLESLSKHLLTERSPITVTQKGILMNVDYIEVDDGFWIVPLDCYLKVTEEPYCIVLRPLNSYMPKSRVRYLVSQEWVYHRLGRDIALRLNTKQLLTKSGSCYVSLEDRVSWLGTKSTARGRWTGWQLK